ncbi:hypothetical protein M0R45_025044 [Rubus argutus]|uniref:Uncharacterized protein n=1 Tax=Rubus argutus TaxID=59490 RepID=A0AAW1WT75_RUBAR
MEKSNSRERLRPPAIDKEPRALKEHSLSLPLLKTLTLIHTLRTWLPHSSCRRLRLLLTAMSSSFSSLFARSSASSRNLLGCEFGSRIYFPTAFNTRNGKPIIPIVNERTLPKFLESARLEKSLTELVPGSNCSLALQILLFPRKLLGTWIGPCKDQHKRFADGEVYVHLGESVIEM